MRTPSSVLSFLAMSAFVLAGSAMADGYGQPQDDRPAYQKPVEGLDQYYYKESCPDMERIVQTVVKQAFEADYTVAAGLIRLFFHDFVVGVCILTTCRLTILYESALYLHVCVVLIVWLVF